MDKAKFEALLPLIVSSLVYALHSAGKLYLVSDIDDYIAHRVKT